MYAPPRHRLLVLRHPDLASLIYHIEHMLGPLPCRKASLTCGWVSGWVHVCVCVCISEFVTECFAVLSQRRLRDAYAEIHQAKLIKLSPSFDSTTTQVAASVAHAATQLGEAFECHAEEIMRHCMPAEGKPGSGSRGRSPSRPPSSAF